jgi:hypothetical protein
MRKRFLTLIALAFILSACSAVTPVPAAVATRTSQSTPLPSPSLPPTPNPSPTISLVPTQELPGGLLLFEFAYVWPPPGEEVAERELLVSQGGNWYPYINMVAPDILLDNSIRVFGEQLDQEKWRIVVSAQGEVLYETLAINMSGYAGLLSAWGYEDHWAIEIVPYQNAQPEQALVDIIIDGESLQQEYGFSEVHSFQLLGNRPLFFYRDNEDVGIVYDGRIIPLEYDSIFLRIFPSLEGSPVPYVNLVVFWADRNDVSCEVYILFPNR